MANKTITFVTGNPNKLREMKQILNIDNLVSNSGFKFKMVSQDIDLPEIQGSSQEVVFHKCLEATKHVNGIVLVEDISLCFDALNGLPGPYIKWFVNDIGPTNVAKLLDGFENKSAYALCSFAYYDPETDNNTPTCLYGKVEGKIVSPRGSGGFGFDSILEVNSKTLAELLPEEKNTVSHRYQAIKMLEEHLKSL